MTLASKAMFAQLSQRIWQANAMDRGLAVKVEKSAKAKDRTMKVMKQLAPTDYILPIRRLANLGREQHERLTLPGLLKGQQLLATRNFDEYAAIQSEIKDNFFVAVRDFCTIYPEIVETAPKRLGAAFNPDDFPKHDDIKDYFSYDIRFSPLPDAEHWLLDGVSETKLAELRNQVENEKNEMFRDATKELFTRAEEVLINIRQQAAEYVDGQSNGSALRDATINAVKDMAQLVGDMNITGDPVLKHVAEEMIHNFDQIEAKELRDNKASRDNVAKTAAMLIDKLKKGMK